jgi:hypothetical protein
MFNPGPRGTLLSDIIDLALPSGQHYDPDLYIQGVTEGNPAPRLSDPSLASVCPALSFTCLALHPPAALNMTAPTSEPLRQPVKTSVRPFRSRTSGPPDLHASRIEPLRIPR